MIFQNLVENFLSVFSQFRLMDIVDLLLVWIVVYQVLILAKRSGAVQILSGLGILAIAYFISIWFELMTFNWILEKFFSNLFLIVVILFQAEIRQALAQIGSSPFFTRAQRIEESHLVEELAKSAIILAQKGHGALIVLEREIALDYFVELGTKIDSHVSSEILFSLFHPTSPLHDGALIIREGRAFTAGCFLPLSKNPILDKTLGTRHRAAIGLTEETDALVIVVSEELKTVSVAIDGQLLPDVDHVNLRSHLYNFFEIQPNLESVHS